MKQQASNSKVNQRTNPKKNKLLSFPWSSNLVSTIAQYISLIALAYSPPLIAIDVADYQEFNIGKQHYRAIKADPKSVKLYWKDEQNQAYGSVRQLKKSLEKAGEEPIFIMNAGIYSDTDTPAGLHIENSLILQSLNTNTGKGNFHLMPNGVFLIDQNNQAAVLTTANYQKHYHNKANTLRLANQSGPMLLINGKINSKFIKKNESYYSRNGVCTTKKGELYFWATDHHPNTQVNLYDFAQSAKKLGCHNALYLDGSISKMYIQKKDSTFHFHHFVGLFAIIKN